MASAPLDRLILTALMLTFVVVVFGAYVRLSDAGLGCPDWPGCYGALSPHHAAEHIASAVAADPGGPVSLPKAWKEMIHRYLASFLGLLLLALAWGAWRGRLQGASRRVALALPLVVGFQGLLGMWTVTLLLKPAIVTAHLLGGMTVLALLGWLALAPRLAVVAVPGGVLRAARFGLVLLVLQIALGGWTSTNYAALACSTDFPACQGQWLPPMDFANAFHVLRELGMTAEGEALPLAALTAIHWSHRVLALLLSLWLLGLALALLRRPLLRRRGALLLAALGLQVGLGIANVLTLLPLPLAVAHNAGAALLLLTLTGINLGLGRVPAPAPERPQGRAAPSPPPEGARKLGAARRFLEREDAT